MTVVFAVAAGLLVLLYICTRTNGKLGVRKGEKPLLKLPLIGDLHDSPIDKPLANWDAWAEHNGAIVLGRLFGIVPIVVLNSAEAVSELFSRRSRWYSNRPASVTMEMITGAEPGQSRFTLMHDYDDHLKLHHRMLAPSLGAVAAPQYQPLMELESKQLLFDLLDLTGRASGGTTVSMNTVYPFLERTQSSIILALHYGLRITRPEEPILHEIVDIQATVTHLAANPALPDLVPVLRHLPVWMSPWKRFANRLYARQVDLYMRLFHHGRHVRGWNATKQGLSTANKYAPKESPVSDLDLAFTLATSVQGGMEILPRQMLWLFIAASHRPAVFAQARAVLDTVVGRDRLPRFSDRPHLALIDAIVHELLRWRPIAPGSIPRRADRNDDYQGVTIKKNVAIMANAWAIGRDEVVFDPALGDVQDFIPERWLRSDPGGETRLHADLPLPVFGQGRRMCQGKRVATDGAFMQVAHLLWAYEIGDTADITVDPWNMTVVGFMTMPTECKFHLRPRGHWVVEVIEREWAVADKSLDRVMGSAHDVEK
ncbi:cytochrome P450 [Aspergillus campestris IBT 28561]|uniref:Cytochrome P450 n=1 Tax=Aspergillus campestris (strain IBT 28561) TaxID=1392248 RepID=A0A2I1CW29_ASPC2|nr:cytochrome P450 [Aspergillus campestris IBT 28561]PKY01831.1 cytochrome P450 [Aspergillus campestris IBT 28561]